jgi:hypothetical protein
MTVLIGANGPNPVGQGFYPGVLLWVVVFGAVSMGTLFSIRPGYKPCTTDLERLRLSHAWDRK